MGRGFTSERRDVDPRSQSRVLLEEWDEPETVGCCLMGRYTFERTLKNPRL